MSSTNPQFLPAVEKCNNCLFLVRQLRARVLKTQQHVFTEVNSLGEHVKENELKSSELLIEKVKVEYEYRSLVAIVSFSTLEAYAKHLPNSLPMFDKIERMKRIFNQDQIDVVRNNLIERMVDSSNWNEANFQIYSYLADFQRNYRRKSSVMVDRPVAYTFWQSSQNPHQQFQTLFAQVQKEFQAKKVGIYSTHLENTSMSSIIELKFGVYSDKQFVCTLKMLMMENNGQIEMVQFIAPHEEWGYNEEMGQKRLDTTRESRYLVYRKLSTQGNLHLMQSINPIFQHADLRAHSSLVQVCYVFSKFQQIFEAPCRTCKKVMRDFLPPLIFDFRQPKNAALHESCK